MDIPLFHVTSKVYGCPVWEKTMEFLLHDPVGMTKSPNGVLGLWISPYPESCMGFGPHVVKIGLAEDFRPVVMPLKQLYGFHMQLQGFDQSEQVHIYARMREDLLELGDVLFIEDANGIGEVIVLNYGIIREFEYLPDFVPKPVKEEYPIPGSWRNPESNALVKSLELRLEPDEYQDVGSQRYQQIA